MFHKICVLSIFSVATAIAANADAPIEQIETPKPTQLQKDLQNMKKKNAQKKKKPPLRASL